jgi:hypothetical protein
MLQASEILKPASNIKSTITLCFMYLIDSRTVWFFAYVMKLFYKHRYKLRVSVFLWMFYLQVPTITRQRRPARWLVFAESKVEMLMEWIFNLCFPAWAKVLHCSFRVVFVAGWTFVARLGLCLVDNFGRLFVSSWTRNTVWVNSEILFYWMFSNKIMQELRLLSSSLFVIYLLVKVDQVRRDEVPKLNSTIT